jgi:type I restriction enzyme S subunit
MLTEWPTVELGAIADVVMGQSPAGAECNRLGQGWPLLNGPTEFGARYPTATQWTTNPSKWAEPEDVLFCVRGSTTGRMNVADQRYVIGRGLAAIRSTQPRLTPFVHYAVQWRLQALLSRTTGSTFPNLNRDSIRGLSVPNPPLDEQRRIAEVLGALDDLIDTNERNIAALGGLAHERFRQVRPSGEQRIFADVVDVFGGGTPSTAVQTFWNGDVPWATPTDLTALTSPYLFGTAKQITKEGLSACSSRLNPVGSILMTSRATIGRIAVAEVPVSTNQGFIVLHPRDELDKFFLFHELRGRIDEFISRANGSTFLEISRGTFKNLLIEWPSVQARKELHQLIAPLHEAAIELERENATLRRTRDELLPLLMSGAVRVRAA